MPIDPLSHFIDHAQRGRASAIHNLESSAWHLACSLLNLQRRLSSHGRTGLFEFSDLVDRDPSAACELLLTRNGRLDPVAYLPHPRSMASEAAPSRSCEEVP